MILIWNHLIVHDFDFKSVQKGFHWSLLENKNCKIFRNMMNLKQQVIDMTKHSNNYNCQINSCYIQKIWLVLAKAKSIQ